MQVAHPALTSGRPDLISSFDKRVKSTEAKNLIANKLLELSRESEKDSVFSQVNFHATFLKFVNSNKFFIFCSEIFTRLSANNPAISSRPLSKADKITIAIEFLLSETNKLDQNRSLRSAHTIRKKITDPIQRDAIKNVTHSILNGIDPMEIQSTLLGTALKDTAPTSVLSDTRDFISIKPILLTDSPLPKLSQEFSKQIISIINERLLYTHLDGTFDSSHPSESLNLEKLSPIYVDILSELSTLFFTSINNLGKEKLKIMFQVITEGETSNYKRAQINFPKLVFRSIVQSLKDTIQKTEFSGNSNLSRHAGTIIINSLGVILGEPSDTHTPTELTGKIAELSTELNEVGTTLNTLYSQVFLKLNLLSRNTEKDFSLIKKDTIISFTKHSGILPPQKLVQLSGIREETAQFVDDLSTIVKMADLTGTLAPKNFEIAIVAIQSIHKKHTALLSDLRTDSVLNKDNAATENLLICLNEELPSNPGVTIRSVLTDLIQLNSESDQTQLTQLLNTIKNLPTHPTIQFNDQSFGDTLQTLISGLSAPNFFESDSNRFLLEDLLTATTIHFVKNTVLPKLELAIKLKSELFLTQEYQSKTDKTSFIEKRTFKVGTAKGHFSKTELDSLAQGILFQKMGMNTESKEQLGIFIQSLKSKATKLAETTADATSLSERIADNFNTEMSATEISSKLRLFSGNIDITNLFTELANYLDFLTTSELLNTEPSNITNEKTLSSALIKIEEVIEMRSYFLASFSVIEEDDFSFSLSLYKKAAQHFFSKDNTLGLPDLTEEIQAALRSKKDDVIPELIYRAIQPTYQSLLFQKFQEDKEGNIGLIPNLYHLNLPSTPEEIDKFTNLFTHRINIYFRSNSIEDITTWLASKSVSEEVVESFRTKLQSARDMSQLFTTESNLNITLDVDITDPEVESIKQLFQDMFTPDLQTLLPSSYNLSDVTLTHLFEKSEILESLEESSYFKYFDASGVPTTLSLLSNDLKNKILTNSLISQTIEFIQDNLDSLDLAKIISVLNIIDKKIAPETKLKKDLTNQLKFFETLQELNIDQRIIAEKADELWAAIVKKNDYFSIWKMVKVAGGSEDSLCAILNNIKSQIRESEDNPYAQFKLLQDFTKINLSLLKEAKSYQDLFLGSSSIKESFKFIQEIKSRLESPFQTVWIQFIHTASEQIFGEGYLTLTTIDRDDKLESLPSNFSELVRNFLLTHLLNGFNTPAPCFESKEPSISDLKESIDFLEKSLKTKLENTLILKKDALELCPDNFDLSDIETLKEEELQSIEASKIPFRARFYGQSKLEIAVQTYNTEKSLAALSNILQTLTEENDGYWSDTTLIPAFINSILGNILIVLSKLPQSTENDDLTVSTCSQTLTTLKSLEELFPSLLLQGNQNIILIESLYLSKQLNLLGISTSILKFTQVAKTQLILTQLSPIRIQSEENHQLRFYELIQTEFSNSPTFQAIIEDLNNHTTQEGREFAYKDLSRYIIANQSTLSTTEVLYLLRFIEASFGVCSVLNKQKELILFYLDKTNEINLKQLKTLVIDEALQSDPHSDTKLKEFMKSNPDSKKTVQEWIRHFARLTKSQQDLLITRIDDYK